MVKLFYGLALRMDLVFSDQYTEIVRRFSCDVMWSSLVLAESLSYHNY